MLSWRNLWWIGSSIIVLLTAGVLVLTHHLEGQFSRLASSIGSEDLVLRREAMPPPPFSVGQEVVSADGEPAPVVTKRQVQASGEGQISRRGELLARLPLGKIFLISPKEMTVGQTEVVSARVGINISDEILRGAVTHDQQTSLGSLRVSSEMEAELDGTAFDISPITKSVQSIAEGDFPTVWKWQVTAEEEGAQTLEATLYALLPEGDTTARQRIDSYAEEIAVKVEPASWTELLAANAWAITGLSLLALASVAIFSIRHRKLKRGLEEDRAFGIIGKDSAVRSPVDYNSVALDDLSGKQQKVLRIAIMQTFPKVGDFDFFLKSELNKGPMGDKVANGGYEQQVQEYLDYVQAEGWNLYLVRALQELGAPGTKLLVAKLCAAADKPAGMGIQASMCNERNLSSVSYPKTSK